MWRRLLAVMRSLAVRLSELGEDAQVRGSPEEWAPEKRVPIGLQGTVGPQSEVSLRASPLQVDSSVLALPPAFTSAPILPKAAPPPKAAAPPGSGPAPSTASRLSPGTDRFETPGGATRQQKQQQQPPTGYSAGAPPASPDENDTRPRLAPPLESPPSGSGPARSRSGSSHQRHRSASPPVNPLSAHLHRSVRPPRARSVTPPRR